MTPHDFYRTRKKEAYSRIRSSPFLKRLLEFIEWRRSKLLVD